MSMWLNFVFMNSFIIIKLMMEEARASIDGHSFRSKRLSKYSNRYEESSLNSEQNQFLKEYQNYSFRTINQIPEKALANRSATISINESPGPFKKKGIIYQLNEKNEMLRKQVQRVQKILAVGDHKKQMRTPKLNEQALKQQLSNAYKQIRIYENQVTERKKLFEHEGSFVDMIRKAELTLLERQNIIKRLQAQISETKKQSNQFVKLLQDGHIKKQYANKSSRLHKQIKYYENMLKDEAALEISDNDNMAKKRLFIKKMQEDLLSTGFSKMELALIRKQFEAERTTTAQVSKCQTISQDRSKATFDALKNQMAILNKMQKDYQKKIEELQKQKEEATEKSIKSKQILEKIQKGLQAAQTQFVNLKKNIDPSKLKPNLKNPSNPNESAFSQFAGIKSSNPLEHRFQAVQIGIFTKKSTVVNDRLVIGRKSAKIIEVTIFQNRTQFLGFKAVYLISDAQMKGGVNMLKRENERFFKQKTTRLEQRDYFKSIACIMSKERIITGVILMSFRGTIVKAGHMQGMKMDMQLNGKEYPCCIYGSYTEKGFQMLGVEKVQSGS